VFNILYIRSQNTSVTYCFEILILFFTFLALLCENNFLITIACLAEFVFTLNDNIFVCLIGTVFIAQFTTQYNRKSICIHKEDFSMSQGAYLLRTGFVATNVSIYMPMPTQFEPQLMMSVFDWIVIQQRLGYSFNWNLSWADYKAGFGSIYADFWLGLEKLYFLTSFQL